MVTQLLEPQLVLTKRLSEQICNVLKNPDVSESLKKDLRPYLDEEKVPFRLLKSVHSVVSKSGEGNIYLHELIDGSDVYLPETKLPSRDPELELRCQKLQAQQENKKYDVMVKNVSRPKTETFSAGQDIKEMNKQLMLVVNFIVTVGGAFAFGYKATEYSLEGFNEVFVLKMIAGMTLATIVFFADLYFILKES